MDTLLIVGGSGFIGGWLTQPASRLFETYGSYFRNRPTNDHVVHYLRLDITNGRRVNKTLLKLRPAVIVHAAAMTPLQCAENREAALRINVIGTKHVVRAAAEAGSRLIFLSSDLVFDGAKGNYTEQDAPEPVCYYGSTKIEGERLVVDDLTSYAIIRTSLVYGYSRNNARCFTEIILEQVAEGNAVRLFTDEYRCPVYIGDLCRGILALANKRELNGTFHICGPERLSRYEYGLRICDSFDLNRNLIIPTDLTPYSENDERPQDCSMCNTKAEDALDMTFSSVDDGFGYMKKGGSLQDRSW